jgi:hypothetical protein
MSAESIRLIANAIKSRLDMALKTAGEPNSALTFVGPLDDDDAKSASLVLFLYRIAPNPSLRNVEHTVSAQVTNPNDPPYQTFSSALALDLHFLLTAGPKDKAGELESLRVLGYAMQALNDSPTLVGSETGGETVRLSLDAVNTEEISRIWALFPTVNYRTSVLYLATPAWIYPATLFSAAPSVVEQGLIAV